MEEKLIKVWKTFCTKELAMIFERYMKSVGAQKLDRHKKREGYLYIIDGKSTDWHRVECYYENWAAESHGEIILKIVLRKEAGDYFIVQRGAERVFEVDSRGVLPHDKDLLECTIEEHKPLFDALFAI